MSIKNLILFFVVAMPVSILAQQTLSTQEAVSLALEHNYGIKIANNTVEIADNNANVLNTEFLPTITGNAGAIHNIDNTEAQFSNGETTVLKGAESDRYNASLNLNFTLFDGLGRHYNYKRLKEEKQLTELEARETIENTMLQLLTVYYTVAQQSENTYALEQTLNISTMQSRF